MGITRQTGNPRSSGRGGCQLKSGPPNSAYAVLGIDNSQSASWKAARELAAETAAAESETLENVAPAPEPKPTRNITDELLKESGYVAAAPNPYQVQTDFFA